MKSLFSVVNVHSSGLNQAETLACRKMLALIVLYETNIWYSHLDVEAHAQGVMVAVVGRILSEVEAGQLRLWIPSVSVVDPSAPHMGWIFPKLLEAQIDEHTGEEISGLLDEADIEVASDDGWLFHVDQLL